MKSLPLTLFAILTVFSAELPSAPAHPASSTAVNENGEIYFVYKGVWKVNGRGELSNVVRTRGGGHWLCLDPQGAFSHGQPKYFERISPDGVKPALIFADGGSPIAVMPDGKVIVVATISSETKLPGEK
jgi:hypothetical protein